MSSKHGMILLLPLSPGYMPRRYVVSRILQTMDVQDPYAQDYYYIQVRILSLHGHPIVLTYFW